MKRSTTRPIAITPGDPCGIGPETIARAWREQTQLTRGCFVAGDVGVMRRALALLGEAVPLPVLEIDAPDEALDAPWGCLPVLQVVDPAPELPWGKVDARAGRLAGECVLWATRAALRGGVAAIVTAPLHKEALHAMMLANDELRTVLVSIHVSRRDALDAITPGQVMQTLQITHDALLRLLGRAPRIAVAGVNPHAGEGGLFGREEIEVLQPVIAQARALGMQVQGPFAPDTVFMRARHAADHPGEFDVVVAMYHDQGLIPVKYLGVEQGVNVTLGLPLIRTSPDHGTAFDLAGQGRADASSLVQALRMARRLAGLPA